MAYELEQDMKGFILVKRELLPTGNAITKWDAGESRVKATSLMQRLNAFPESTLEICKDGLYVTWIGIPKGSILQKASYRVKEIAYKPTALTMADIFKKMDHGLFSVKTPDEANREKVWTLTYAAALKYDFKVSEAIAVADNALVHFDKLFTKTTKL